MEVATNKRRRQPAEADAEHKHFTARQETVEEPPPKKAATVVVAPRPPKQPAVTSRKETVKTVDAPIEAASWIRSVSLRFPTRLKRLVAEEYWVRSRAGTVEAPLPVVASGSDLVYSVDNILRSFIAATKELSAMSLKGGPNVPADLDGVWHSTCDTLVQRVVVPGFNALADGTLLYPDERADAWAAMADELECSPADGGALPWSRVLHVKVLVRWLSLLPQVLMATIVSPTGAGLFQPINSPGSTPQGTEMAVAQVLVDTLLIPFTEALLAFIDRSIPASTA